MKRTLLSFCLLVASAGVPTYADVGDGQTIYIQLGENFQADLGREGGTVYANFNAPDETIVDVNIRASQLTLYVALFNNDGDAIDLGGSLNLGQFVATIDAFEIPASDNYTLVIAGSPIASDGNGTFQGPGNNGGSQDADGQADGLIHGGGKSLAPAGRIVVETTGKVKPDLALSTFSGTITNQWTADPLEGAEVLVGPFVLVSDENGYYEDEVPSGLYDVTYQATYFVGQDYSLVLFPDVPMTLDVGLVPTAPVIVTIGVTGDIEPDGMVEAMANVIVLDGSDILGYAWEQFEGVEALLSNADTELATLELGAKVDYRALLMHILEEPPIGPDQLPPNVPPPPDDFPGGLQDRFYLPGASPFAIEETAVVGLDVMVTTTSGVYGAETEIHTHLPWSPTASINTVPVRIPVLVHGKEQASYDWMLTPPPLSDTVLEDGTMQSPEFTPDWPGEYLLTVTDLATGEPVNITVYAGNWEGVVIGQDMDGLPIADAACVNCHSNLLSGDKFAEWRETGHARVLSDNLNTSTHYGPNCFPCHSVGHNTTAQNQGMDDRPDYLDFLDAGLLNVPGDNWTTMLANFPETARMSNIQCENCHGPQNGYPGTYIESHTDGGPRITLASDVCATCHGEPLRHGRFQQWQLSQHANYDLAIDESQSTTCAKCHTANGFLAWASGDEPANPDTPIEVTWTEDEAHPITCVVCHDPHQVGTTSGDNTDAPMRFTDHSPPLYAGFTAYGVGSGAMCMPCHNSRRGLRNDSTFDDYYGGSDIARAPHGPTQTDIMMGQNAFNVPIGLRANHSFLEDSCVQCHLHATPPVGDLAYNLSGTNHTFFAGTDICADCHTGYDADSIQHGVEDTLHILADVITASISNFIDDQVMLGNKVDIGGEFLITEPGTIELIELTESRGRQAIFMTIDGVTSGAVRLGDVVVLDPDDVELGEIYNLADPDLAKAGWNYFLVHNDGSLGIHNPTWTYLVLSEAIMNLDMRAAPPVPDWFDKSLLEQTPDMGQPAPAPAPSNRPVRQMKRSPLIRR
jgi:hypothetical protein